MTQLTITQARRGFLNLPERLARMPERAVTITRRGRPVLAVTPWEFYQSIVETLDVLSDPEMVLALAAPEIARKRSDLSDFGWLRGLDNAECYMTTETYWIDLK